MDEFLLWLGNLSSFRNFQEKEEKIVKLSLEERAEAKKAFEDNYHTDEEDEWGTDHPLLSRYDNVGVVSVRGSISNREDDWISELFGITTYEGIRNALAIAAEDESIDAILMDFDTPGGSVAGISETSEFLREVKKIKPVYGYAEAALSAGYWLASNTDAIYAPEMGELGSIGVIAITMEYTERMKKEGITPHVMKSGERKALGNPYEKLTDSGKEVLQSRVDETAQFFITEISNNRGMSFSDAEEMATGDFWFARKAIELNLADGIESFNKLVQTLQSKHKSDGGDNMPKRRILNSKGVAALESGASITEVLKTQGFVEEVEEDTKAEEARKDVSAEGSEEDSDPDSEEEQSAEGEEGEDQDDDEPEEEEGSEAKVASGKGSADGLLEKLLASEKRVAILEHEVERKEASERDQKELMEQYESYVRTAVERMSIPLGGNGAGLSDLSGRDLINQAHLVRKQFEAKIHVGQSADSSIEVTSEDETGSGASPEYQQARSNSTRIKRGK